MNDRTPCATPEALVTYLYEECEPAERQSIAAHVEMCPLCADEVRTLSDTRAHLTSWSPPALSLGFQITRTEGDQPAKVLDFAEPASRSSKSGSWWRQPLPAWAQAAAAVVIFAAGMSVNAFRSVEQPTRVVQAPATQNVAVATDRHTDDLSVTREEFARLESRLRAMERADVSRASYVPGTDGQVDANELGAQVRTLQSRVADSERQNLDTFAKLARALEANRRDIDASREATQKITLMDEELQDHRQVLRSALVPGLAVRTALTGSGR